MRKWRVGTVSMGLSMISLGVALLFFQGQGKWLVEVLIAWWPMIFIILGIEILVYYFFAKQEESFIKYDILSILFIGILGTVGICFTLLSSLGLIDEVRFALQAESKTLEMPEAEFALPENIKQIVLELDYPVTIESANTSKVHVFGTYFGTTYDSKDILQSANDYILSKMVGDTLYLQMKAAPMKNGPFSSYTRLEPTIIVPKNIQLEIRGQGHDLFLYPKDLADHWLIQGGGEVLIQTEKTANIQIKAEAYHELVVNNGDAWETLEAKEHSNEEVRPSVHRGILRLGEGKNLVEIIDSNGVRVQMVESSGNVRD